MEDEELRVRNVVNLWILLSLWRNGSHGYELIKEIEDATGRRPSASQVYPFLQKLEANGLVSAEETGGRGKKVYALTEEGRTFVESKMEMFSSVISSTVEKDLTVCAHCGCKVYQGGHRETVGGEELRFCCSHCAESYRRAMRD
ncbi:MAG: hypothetical protein MAG715_00347 [Methanonatronarchaeales archaeon]|nr:hypothetical protein [Methanonatronarchaeales archaeon]